jgi:hypothetical protein
MVACLPVVLRGPGPINRYCPPHIRSAVDERSPVSEAAETRDRPGKMRMWLWIYKQALIICRVVFCAGVFYAGVFLNTTAVGVSMGCAGL